PLVLAALPTLQTPPRFLSNPRSGLAQSACRLRKLSPDHRPLVAAATRIGNLRNHNELAPELAPFRRPMASDFQPTADLSATGLGVPVSCLLSFVRISQ